MLILLRAQTSHDFSQYKTSTLYRRIERRTAVHQIATLDRYVQYSQQTPTEVNALFRDLLIGVTQFFRDPEVFQALEQRIIPKLFVGKPANAVIRLWSAGCSTGGESYSLAILMAEAQEALKQSFKVQVFATDIDGQAIATGRAGLYPASIASDLSPERLARFFTAEPEINSYRIRKSIRDLLVFSEQNLIRDPPFSKLDLISCRNLSRDGWIFAECPASPGCVSQGQDEKEALNNIKEAIEAWLWAEDQKALSQWHPTSSKAKILVAV